MDKYQYQRTNGNMDKTLCLKVVIFTFIIFGFIAVFYGVFFHTKFLENVGVCWEMTGCKAEEHASISTAEIEARQRNFSKSVSEISNAATPTTPRTITKGSLYPSDDGLTENHRLRMEFRKEMKHLENRINEKLETKVEEFDERTSILETQLRDLSSSLEGRKRTFGELKFNVTEMKDTITMLVSFVNVTGTFVI